MFFGAEVRVLKKLESQVNMNDFIFDTYWVEAGNIEITALIAVTDGVHEGDCLRTERAYFTHCLISGVVQFCLRLKDVHAIREEDYKKKDSFEVVVSGRVKKVKDTKIRKVTVYATPFLTSTLRVRNEIRASAGIRLLSFRGFAQTMFDLPELSLVRVRAKLRKSKADGKYELDIQELMEVRPWRNAMEKEKEGIVYGNA